MKEEPLNTSIKPGRNPNMSQETNDSYDILHDELFKTFKLFEEPFQDLIAQALDSGGVNLEDSVDLLLTDPPYNIRKDAGKENSDHDAFSDDDMKELAEFSRKVLKKGGHGIIFCAFSQFETYRTLLSSFNEQVLDFDTDPTGNTYKTEKVFQVEPSPFLFVKKTGHHNNPRRKNLHHVNVVEICVHFWRNGGAEQQRNKRLDYQTPSGYGETHPSWTNVVTEVPIVTGEEVIYLEGNGGTGNARKRLRPEQKPISLMKFLVNKFTKGGDLVVDTCAGTFSTLKACMEMDNHRRFIGTDMDENCAAMVEDSVIEMFATQLLNQKSDLITQDIKVRKAAQLVSAEVNRQAVQKRADAWSTPQGLVPMQNFPPYIVEYLCQYHMDFSLYPHRHLSMNRWSLLWIQRMNSVDIRAVMAYEASKWDLVVKKSTIKHPNAGCGLFTTKPISKKDIVGYYYGALIYGDIGADRRLHKRYGNGILSCSSEEFNKWSNQIDHEFCDTKGQRYKCFIAPAPFCVTKMINDPRYVEGDAEKEESEGQEAVRRRPNVQFAIDKKAKWNKDFEIFSAIQVVATADIAAGTELFADYGQNYQFPISKK